MAPKKKAPLKTGPKGPTTGGGPLNATKMANYRKILHEEQENALKYLKKKEKKQGLTPGDMKKKVRLEKELGKACGQCGK